VIAATSQARPHTQGAQPMSALGFGRVKTKSDLFVMPIR
jgi:hypothetical protein